ncbi:MAG: DNA-3-methyladenine glycosylase [Flavobacteriales bacterium]|nr:DNA-3-methyladenine glycosylase [Flavobacteriales bacterium]
MKLPSKYFQNEDVVFLAKDLIGKVLCSYISGKFTSGIITETEAYNGVVDKACHAYGNRRTKRTETMYTSGGVTYVYLCYGIHHLFNVVTSVKNDPKAILIRGIQPLDGLSHILDRRGKTKLTPKIASGPGTMSQALGIKTAHNAMDLQSESIWIEDRGIQILRENIQSTPRIGIDYAHEDILLPYRFVLNKGSIILD